MHILILMRASYKQQSDTSLDRQVFVCFTRNANDMFSFFKINSNKVTEYDKTKLKNILNERYKQLILNHIKRYTSFLL